MIHTIRRNEIVHIAHNTAQFKNRYSCSGFSFYHLAGLLLGVRSRQRALVLTNICDRLTFLHVMKQKRNQQK